MASHELNIRKPYFDLIASGVKTVEVRVGYPKIRKIQPGDELAFVSGEERLPTTVIRVTEYAPSRSCWTTRILSPSLPISARIATNSWL